MQILTYHQATGFVVSKEYLDSVSCNAPKDDFVLESSLEQTRLKFEDEELVSASEGRVTVIGSGQDHLDSVTYNTPEDNFALTNSLEQTRLKSEDEEPVYAVGFSLYVIRSAQDHFDVYTAASDGGVYVIPLEEAISDKTRRWKRLGELRVAEDSYVSAGTISDDTVAVFAVDVDGRICAIVGTLDWDHMNEWKHIDGIMYKGVTGVTLVSSPEGILSLFIVGNGGHIFSTQYDVNAGSTSGWHQIGDLTVNQKTRIKPFRLSNGNVNILVNDYTSFNGEVFTNTLEWASGHSEWASWNPIPGGCAKIFGRLEAVAVSSNILAAFVCGLDDRIWMTTWILGKPPSEFQPIGDLKAVGAQFFSVLSPAPNVTDIFSGAGLRGTVYAASLRPDLGSFDKWRSLDEAVSDPEWSPFSFKKTFDGPVVYTLDKYILSRLANI